MTWLMRFLFGRKPTSPEAAYWWSREIDPDEEDVEDE